jgi:hypothetical protein
LLQEFVARQQQRTVSQQELVAKARNKQGAVSQQELVTEVSFASSDYQTSGCRQQKASAQQGFVSVSQKVFFLHHRTSTLFAAARTS